MKMSHKKKIEWMAVWAAKNNLQLTLKGECGFGRECVGVTVGGKFPDYEWFDDGYERIDGNGDVWIPEGAYHKHPCVAVLGRGRIAEEQLYEWLKWFDDNGFRLETGTLPVDPGLPSGMLSILFKKNTYVRMVKKVK